MAECRESWPGEIVLTLAGDEQNMGSRGTHYLLDTVSHATGDAVISGDVGSPLVVYFGEKGILWLELCASGKSAHGAHIRQGENAIERLIDGISKIKECLRAMEINTSEKILKVITSVESEDNLEVLQAVTAKINVIAGGVLPNLVPAKATAVIDIRIPIGLSVAHIEQRIQEVLDPFPWFSSTILHQHEPNWSDMDHEIFSFLTENIQEVMKQVPVVTLRLGGSDARLYRLLKGIPSADCGLTAYNFGGPDEYIEVSELMDVAKIHTLTACDFLLSSHLDRLK
jgi:succinyl-diaminopimelate desuccinylase